MNNTQQLPDEVVEKILRARDALILGDQDEAYHQLYGIANPGYDSYFPWEGFEQQISYPKYYESEIKARRQVTEYAAKLHQAEQENAQLKRWKMEAAELLTPIHAYVHKNMEVSLGQCNVKLVLDRCKQYDAARALLEKIKNRYEAGLIDDTPFYDEIKQFLDGTK